ncbi:MAG: histone deacetylase [Pirellulales bacterium]
MTLLYTDDRFLGHETGRHPEQPDRLRLDHEAPRRRRTRQASDAHRLCRRDRCATSSLSRSGLRQATPRIDRGRARRPGRARYIVSAGSYDAALLAAGTVCDAVKRVLGGEDKSALCLVRPPGHHALKAAPMGFCLFNNIAIGARAAIAEHGLERVLIVDWDVHHGNGTQDEFYDDGQIGFYSIHRSPFYPGSGDADETGRGRGLGTTLNVPVEYGTPRKKYFELFRAGLDRIAERMKPQLVLISAGFDAHKDDPIGSLDLETDDFVELTKLLQAVSTAHADGRLLSVLEGGYNLDALAASASAHLKTLLA